MEVFIWLGIIYALLGFAIATYYKKVNPASRGMLFWVAVGWPLVLLWGLAGFLKWVATGSH